MTIDLNRLAELESKATKGPWHDASGKGSAVVSAPGENCAIYLNVRSIEDNQTVKRWQADAAFISEMRNSMPALLAELRELRQKSDSLELERDVLKIELQTLDRVRNDLMQASRAKTALQAQLKELEERYLHIEEASEAESDHRADMVERMNRE